MLTARVLSVLTIKFATGLKLMVCLIHSPQSLSLIFEHLILGCLLNLIVLWRHLLENPGYILRLLEKEWNEHIEKAQFAGLKISYIIDNGIYVIRMSDEDYQKYKNKSGISLADFNRIVIFKCL